MSTRLRRAAEATPGLHRIERPVTDERDSATFSLAYVRTTPGLGDDTQPATAESGPPVLIIPGGPGLASAVPYRALRQKAVRRGLDVIMLEHRGVGLSRSAADGSDLPLEAMRISLVVDDIRAVLDAEGIGRVTVVGSSYGSYVALALAVTLPHRVAGIVLDSPMLEAGKQDVRAWADGLLYDGTLGDETHRRVARKVRDIERDGLLSPEQLSRAVRIVYEFAGMDTLDALLNQIAVGRARTTLATLGRLGQSDTDESLPYYMEFDRVGEIAFRELDFADSDSEAFFDTGASFHEVAKRFSPFSAEPFHLAAALPSLTVPVVALSGDRDLRTPRPVAERIAHLAPRGVLATVPDHGHSALDTHVEALFAAIRLAIARMGAGGGADELHAESPPVVRLEGLSRSGGPSAMLGGAVRAQLAADRLLPRRR
ncbi:alpha/beta fold hydrolase [Brevibacterium jeotgali]|uniref:Pimeloyl-ACP methyl ester carboxylesterase n=1 Tax=Brevibacterium jeotgali TaxID=1262550 RepID=A0A2H1L2T8_9MICO|nr:alpha/beta hydrolase [Brevibacterium jeotgali]TWC02429.1 pimeloyl-ACP methyl ester carboxylesterase [Brevibacterium jeotgali]SMY11221.1 Pimeloyl-ACP methyl ester carboxylesterase [Brevibacterium jeotgali]